MSYGVLFALLGAATAMCSGIGSSIGVSRAGQASAALLSKEPNKFGTVLVLQLLPASQAIYGFVCAVFAFIAGGLLGGDMTALTVEKGFAIFAACIPVGLVGGISAVMQGNVAIACINLTGKQEGQMGKSITMTVLVEIFAILSFIVSLLALIFLRA